VRNLEEATVVGSVDRALQLLIMLREGGPVSVKAASERLDVAPSTAYRLFATLTTRGFAVQDDDRRYRAGPELIARVVDQVSLDMLRRVTRPLLQELHEEIGDTVQLMLLVGSNIRFIDGIESNSALRVAARIGDQMPAYCSAGGKAMLAGLPWSEVERRHPGGLTRWPSAKITSMATLQDELTRTRTARYGLNSDETELGVTGVGVTIHDRAGSPVAAFTAAIPSARFQRRNLAHYVQVLTTAANTASDRLNGGRDNPP
jgi:IclR family transcriptional regulator, acetate operon repressor